MLNGVRQHLHPIAALGLALGMIAVVLGEVKVSVSEAKVSVSVIVAITVSLKVTVKVSIRVSVRIQYTVNVRGGVFVMGFSFRNGTLSLALTLVGTTFIPRTSSPTA